MKVLKVACITTLLALLLGGCSAQKIVQRDDPLIGQIIEARNGEAIGYADLIERAAGADVIYLGERHDNAEHHRLQLQVLQSLLDKGIKPALGFEFFDVGQTGYLQQFVERKPSAMQLTDQGKSDPKTPEQWLRERLGWQERDDQDWGYYFALIELAREHKLPIFGADLPTAIKLRLSRSGLDKLNGVERGLIINTGLEDDAYKELMYQRFKAGHCGWGREPMLTYLYQTWLARNDRMATSVVEMKRQYSGLVALVLGNGHIEYDQGVPERVRALAPELVQLNLGWREIAIEPLPLDEYLAAETVSGKGFGTDNQLFWFTQRQDYVDLCAQFNKPKN